MEGFLVLHSFPLGNSSLASHFASKTLAFHGISTDHPWDGYIFFPGANHYIVEKFIDTARDFEQKYLFL